VVKIIPDSSLVGNQIILKKLVRILLLKAGESTTASVTGEGGKIAVILKKAEGEKPDLLLATTER